MKIGALYLTRTLPVARRVLFPYSVLAERGHSFSFLQVPSLTAGLAYDYDVTVLPQWELTDEGVADLSVVSAQGKALVYDLTDKALLESEAVRRTLSLCRLVTVPNDYFKKEVRLLVGNRTRIEVLPSVVNPSFFAHARRQDPLFTIKPGTLVIGAFGPHDWHLVAAPLKEFCAKHPRTLILTEQWIAQGPLSAVRDSCFPADVSIEVYPWLLLQCAFGLCPLESNTGQETIWAHEYGILCRPVIASTSSPYQMETPHVSLVSNALSGAWLRRMEDLATSAEKRAALGTLAFREANKMRATEQVKHYARALSNLLPQSAMMR